MSNITSAIPPPNSIWNGTEVPTDTPTSLLPSPVDTNYYAPSKSQILMYIVIVSIIIALIAFLSRCVRMLISFLITFLAECHFLNIFSLCTWCRRAGNTQTTMDPSLATNDTSTSQDRADLVKSMTPEERKFYVTNFLRTQVFNNFVQSLVLLLTQNV